MKIYNVTGAEVATLVNEHQVAGKHEIVFDGAALSGGVYFCKIVAGKRAKIAFNKSWAGAVFHLSNPEKR